MKVLRKVMLIAVIVIIVLVASLEVGAIMFNRNVGEEVKRLFANSEDVSEMTFKFDQISKLPEPVQRYFRYSLEDGQHYISYVRLKHGGTFRQSKEQDWMKIVGEEYFTAQRPGFVWLGKISPFPLFWINGRDMYIEGKGNLQIKLLSIFTVADAKGREFDEGELVRWLAEAPMFPTALLPSKYLHWEEVDSSSAKVVVEDGGLTASVVFYFNERGEIVQMVADRWYDTGGGSYSKEKWVGYYRDYSKRSNMMIPQELEVAWSLSSGEFSYARFKVTDIEFNNPTRWES